MADVQNRISQKTPENNNFEFGRLKAALNKTLSYICANQAPFLNKIINKEIMKMAWIRNKFSNTQYDIDRKAYIK